jgi:hypothetical protein
MSGSISADCHNPKPEDWGYFELLPESVWWLEIRTLAGQVGLTNLSESFSIIGECS